MNVIPALSGGSASAPWARTRLTVTTGRRWCSTTTTCNPVSSVARVTAGVAGETFASGGGGGVRVQGATAGAGAGATAVTGGGGVGAGADAHETARAAAMTGAAFIGASPSPPAPASD